MAVFLSNHKLNYWHIFYFFYLIMLLSSCNDMGGFALESKGDEWTSIVLDNNAGKAELTTYIGNQSPVKWKTVNGARLIFPSVTEVQYDEQFILVDRIPSDSICECNDSCAKKKYTNWDDLPTVRVCAEAIRRSNIHEYVIIDKHSNSLYWDESKEGYFRRRKALKVPDNLRLAIDGK